MTRSGGWTGKAPWCALLAALLAALLLAGCATAPATQSDQTDLTPAADAWRAGNYTAALPLLERAASRGNARAQYALGYMYYHGQGVTADMDTALTWIRRAAANGDSRAIEALGVLAGAASREGKGREGVSGNSDPAPAPTPQPGDGRTGEKS